MEDVDDAERQHAEDEAVEFRVGRERLEQRRRQRRHDDRYRDHE